MVPPGAILKKNMCKYKELTKYLFIMFGSALPFLSLKFLNLETKLQ